MKILKTLKQFLARKLFAHGHIYSGNDLANEDDPECMICGKPLSDFQKPRKTHEQWAIRWCILLALTLSNAHAVKLASYPADSVYLRDSVYLIPIALEAQDCSRSQPCQIQVYDGAGGLGSVFNPVLGNPGDTLRIAYNFPASHFGASAKEVAFVFLDWKGVIRAQWVVKLGYKDPSPPTSRVGEVKARKVRGSIDFKRLPRIDGRVR